MRVYQNLASLLENANALKVDYAATFSAIGGAVWPQVCGRTVVPRTQSGLLHTIRALTVRRQKYNNNNSHSVTRLYHRKKSINQRNFYLLSRNRLLTTQI